MRWINEHAWYNPWCEDGFALQLGVESFLIDKWLVPWKMCDFYELGNVGVG